MMPTAQDWAILAIWTSLCGLLKADEMMPTAQDWAILAIWTSLCGLLIACTVTANISDEPMRPKARPTHWETTHG